MSVKTPTPKKLKYNVGYEIKCIQCNSTYIGQTCRFLHTRMLEHARSIKNYNANSTALAQHAHKFKHTFDFKEVQILEHEKNFLKRLPRNDSYKKKTITQLTSEQILKI